MSLVLTPIDAVAGLAEAIELRSERGLDTYDEWWEGVYRIVTGPSPEHGELAVWLGAMLMLAGRRVGLHVAAPINIGVDKYDCRVPDLGVYAPDTPRHSPAFLTTASLVVELLSPGEPTGAKLDFYLANGVLEVLEVNVATSVASLQARPVSGTAWSSLTASVVVPGLEIIDGVVVVDGERPPS